MRLVISPFEAEHFDVQPCYHIAKERIKKYFQDYLRDNGLHSLAERVSLLDCPPRNTANQPERRLGN